jgi:hypothetical protein
MEEYRETKNGTKKVRIIRVGCISEFKLTKNSCGLLIIFKIIPTNKATLTALTR